MTQNEDVAGLFERTNERTEWAGELVNERARFPALDNAAIIK